MISGNLGDGIYIDASSGGNTVQGSFIGTDANGDAAIANARDGIEVDSPSNVIGDSNGLRNVISGNLGDGILISGASAAHNAVLGNMIGTNLQTNAAIANGENGIECPWVAGDVDRRNGLGPGNVISGNAGCGVLVSDPSATETTIYGNLIGTDLTSERISETDAMEFN